MLNKLNMESIISFKDAKDVSNHWGDLMPMMAMEEAGEFIQAISKLERAEKTDNEGVPSQVRENALINLEKEIADLYIAMAALRWRYGIMDFDIQRHIDEKLNKKY